MQDEGVVAADLDQLGQLRLVGPHVDVRVAAVAEDAKAAVQVQVYARGLHRIGDVRVDDDPAGLDLRPDVAIGEDHYRSAGVRCFISRSTSRLRVEMSS